MPDLEAPPGFDELWRRYPWPDEPPEPDAPAAGRHSSGFDLLTDHISRRGGRTVVVEVGAEFGGSTRRFLGLPDTWVVSVDPWPDTYGSRSFPELSSWFGRPDAVYHLFQSFCWGVRDRLATVRDVSPSGLVTVHAAGIPVDVVYVDGDHRYDAVMRDLAVADALFPGAILCGDDWSMRSDRAKYEGMGLPVRRAVTSWAAFNDVHVEVSANTWMLDRSRPFNLAPPPPRFTDVDDALRSVQRRLGRIERAVTAPSLARRIEGRVRSTITSTLRSIVERRRRSEI